MPGAGDHQDRRRRAVRQVMRARDQRQWATEHYRSARKQRLVAMQATWRARSRVFGRFGPVVAMAEDVEDAIGDLGLALVEAAPDALVMANEGGQILLVNRQTELLFGYDRDELVGQPIEVLLPERYRQLHRAHRTRYRVEPTVRAMGAGLQLHGLRKDGAEFPVEISLSPLVAPGGVRVVAAVRDMSERALAEARVREVQRVLDATRDAVLMFDPDTLVFAYVNQGAIDQLGYSRDELLTMTPLHIKPALTEAAYRELMASVAPGQSYTYTTVHRRKDGDDIDVEAVLVRPPEQQGREGWLVSIARDISDRLAAEQRAHAAERYAAVLEDRQRIARDLHDQVIQRLFAAGLGLSGMAAAAQDAAEGQRLNQVVDDLDDTIRQLRASIFQLSRLPASASLRATVIDVCRGERAALGFDPSVRFEGPVDTVGTDLMEDVVAVLREALSNAARHARANAVDVTLTAGRDFTMTVVDDGVGPPDGTEPIGNGIDNMHARSAALGGTFTLRAGEPSGTVLVWQVPLVEAALAAAQPTP